MKIIQAFRLLSQSWLESLTFFSPHTFIPFFLITIKAWLESYKKLIISIPIGIIAFVVLWAFLYFLSVYQHSNLPTMLMLVALILYAYALIVRPSVDKKDQEYIGRYYISLKFSYWLMLGALPLIFIVSISHMLINLKMFYCTMIGLNIAFIIIAVISIIIKKYNLLKVVIGSALLTTSLTYLIYSIPHLFRFVLKIIFMSSYPFSIVFYNNTFIIALLYFFSPLIILILLFMLDVQLKLIEAFKALLRAVTFLVYNYPFLAITYWVIGLLLYVLYNVGIPTLVYIIQTIFNERISSLLAYSISSNLISGIVFLVIFPFYFCLITNYYFKRIHDQFYIYYKS